MYKPLEIFCCWNFAHAGKACIVYETRTGHARVSRFYFRSNFSCVPIGSSRTCLSGVQLSYYDTGICAFVSVDTFLVCPFDFKKQEGFEQQL